MSGFVTVPVGSQNLTVSQAMNEFAPLGYYAISAYTGLRNVIVAESSNLFYFKVASSDYQLFMDFTGRTIPSGNHVVYAALTISDTPINYTTYSEYQDVIRHSATELRTFPTTGRKYYVGSYFNTRNDDATYIGDGIYADLTEYTIADGIAATGVSAHGALPITYRPTNCSFPNAPTEAEVGDTVNVHVTFPEGYGLVNESNIYVTNNGVVIPSTYSNGQLTFTMPDPS